MIIVSTTRLWGLGGLYYQVVSDGHIENERGVAKGLPILECISQGLYTPRLGHALIDFHVIIYVSLTLYLESRKA